MQNHRSTARQQLEACLLESLLNKSYREISVSDLCHQAGISRKSFYRYFGSKDGCLHALLHHLLTECSRFECPELCTASGIEGDFQRMLIFWQRNGEILRALIANDLSARLLHQMIAHLVSEEKSMLVSNGLIPSDTDPEMLMFSTAGYITILLNWVESGYQKSVPEMAAILTRLFTRPMVPEL